MKKKKQLFATLAIRSLLGFFLLWLAFGIIKGNFHLGGCGITYFAIFSKEVSYDVWQNTWTIFVIVFNLGVVLLLLNIAIEISKIYKKVPLSLSLSVIVIISLLLWWLFPDLFTETFHSPRSMLPCINGL